MDGNATGRLDLLLVRLLETCVRRYLEPRVGVPLWNPQVEIAVTKFVQMHVPAEPVTFAVPPEVCRVIEGIDKMRAAGLIPPAKEAPRVRA